MKSIARQITPPIIWEALKSFMRKSDNVQLFDGCDEMFKRIVLNSAIYFEYGCGMSTIWVAKNTKASIFSVDSSQDWIAMCSERVAQSRVRFDWVDCGPLGPWGTPVGFTKRGNFKKYATSIWSHGASPDTVLIDGRFRVLCFLTSLKHAKEGTKIIFDDYTNRPSYHIVEELLAPSDICGRQCLFVVPERSRINISIVEDLIEKFEYVTD